MTTAERIQSIGYRVWVPTTIADSYTGRHRAIGRAALSLDRVLYVARHLRRADPIRRVVSPALGAAGRALSGQSGNRLLDVSDQ